MPPTTSADLSSKLSAPSKKSFFERQKAEAEARKARADAETAAVLKEFEASFDHDERSGPPQQDFRSSAGRNELAVAGAGVTSGGFAGGGGPGKRHFTNTSLKSGPGSLGGLPRSGLGGLGPTPQKRRFEEYRGRERDRDTDRGRGMFSYDDDERAGYGRRDREEVEDVKTAFKADEEEDSKTTSRDDSAAAKPTLHLSSLPPGTSPAVVKALITPYLTVESVRIIPPPAPSGPTPTDRKSTTALVSLAPSTPATDIDTTVSQLQNAYLGFGFNLSISRHLSSAALASSALPSISTPALGNLPFGARSIPQFQSSSFSRAPPPSQSGRFAPPASYTSSTPYSSRGAESQTEVRVAPPQDLTQLKLIHKMLEALLTHGPEFEALLMSRPEVQRDSKWAWLWNARSREGVYYRWRLWDILTDGAGRRRKRSSGAVGEEVFGGKARWVPPEEGFLRFEYTTKLDEFVEDGGYDSSEEEEDGGGGGGGLAGRYNDHNHLGGGPSVEEGLVDNDGVGYLNPLAKAKLVHLLARLPENSAKLRRGDVARATAFAIECAGKGASEVVDLVVGNVMRPLRYTSANQNKKTHGDEENEEAIDEKIEIKKDTTPASLVALYVISDILSSSSTSGVRHSWRYRALFESALKKHKVFEKLGRVGEELGWGKLKMEKWRRSVNAVLTLWEGWCVFGQGSHEDFVKTFETAVEKRAEVERVERETEMHKKIINKWRSVDEGAGSGFKKAESGNEDVEMAEADDDVDGEPMVSDEEDSIGNENVDGEPMVDSSEDEQEATLGKAEVLDRPKQDHTPAKRQRPRAVDMFADDSGGEE